MNTTAAGLLAGSGMAGRWLGRRGWRGAGVLGDARVDVGAADDGVAGVVAVEPAAAAVTLVLLLAGRVAGTV